MNDGLAYSAVALPASRLCFRVEDMEKPKITLKESINIALRKFFNFLSWSNNDGLIYLLAAEPEAPRTF